MRRAMNMRRASPLPRSCVSVKFLVEIYYRFYERMASPPWRDLSIVYPRSRLGGLEMFHINTLKRAGPPRRASKSKLGYTGQSLSWPVFFWITFNFTSSVCLCANIGFRVSWDNKCS